MNFIIEKTDGTTKKVVKSVTVTDLELRKTDKGWKVKPSEENREKLITAIRKHDDFTENLFNTSIPVLMRMKRALDDGFVGTFEAMLDDAYSGKVTRINSKDIEAKAKAESRLEHLRTIESTVAAVPKAAKAPVLKGFGFQTIEDLQAEIAGMLNEISPEETDETKSASVAEMINYLSNRHPEKQSEYLKLSAEQLKALVEAEAKTET